MFKNSIMAMAFGGLLVPSGLCAMDGSEQPVEEETKEAAAAQELTPAERRALLTPDQREEIDQKLIRLISLLVPPAQLKNVRNQVKGVLERGADVNARDKRGMLALKIAIERRNGRAAQELINFGADATQADWVIVKQMRKNEKLKQAIENNNIAAAANAFDTGADGDSPDFYGSIPLEEATYKGNRDMVALLLDRDVVVNKPGNSDDRYQLMYATEGGHRDIVQQLIIAGVELLPTGTNEIGEMVWLSASKYLSASLAAIKARQELGAQDWVREELSEYQKLTPFIPVDKVQALVEGYADFYGDIPEGDTSEGDTQEKEMAGQRLLNGLVRQEIERRQYQRKKMELISTYLLDALSRLIGDYVGFYKVDL